MTEAKRLFITPGRCIGCRGCELACAFAHPVQKKTLGGTTTIPGRTRIRAYPMDAERHVPVVCLQCDTAACVAVCPTNALVRNKATGAIEVLTERCVRCMMCTVACPFGNIHDEPSASEIVKCDLCGGDPACAKFCPSAALTYGAESNRNPPPKPHDSAAMRMGGLLAATLK
jgi:anaerobic carbon-monoxide dehydrogenase iron sulfur subunit